MELASQPAGTPLGQKRPNELSPMANQSMKKSCALNRRSCSENDLRAPSSVLPNENSGQFSASEGTSEATPTFKARRRGSEDQPVPDVHANLFIKAPAGMSNVGLCRFLGSLKEANKITAIRDSNRPGHSLDRFYEVRGPRKALIDISEQLSASEAFAS